MENSNLKLDLEKIDKVISDSNEAIEKGKALDRLMKNADFKSIILDGYFETEAKKLFQILTDPTGATPYTEETILMKLASISDFKRYVGTEDYPGTIKIEADKAPHDILREEQYRIEMTARYAEDERENT